MKKIIIASLMTTSFAACNKKDDPVPVEQELITTLVLNIKEANGVSTPFRYRIENGFGSTTPGTVQIDTIKLKPNTTYSINTEVLDQKSDPWENLTNEVISENEEHLFLYISDPVTGTGSITPVSGNLDDAQQPFNQTVTITTDAAGNGTFTVYLLHAPTNKSGTTPAAAGGETDVEAVFPVRIQ